MNKIYSLLVLGGLSLSLNLFGQAVPELIYYKFDSGSSIVNDASSPVGTNPTTITGTTLTVGGTGMFGTALLGTGGTSSAHRIATGWATSLSSSFTIGFWTDNITSSSTLWYVFGDNTASSLRCFTNGVAGANNWLLRCTGCGMPDITATNGATTGSNYTHFVYDATASMMRAYVNGVKVDSAAVTGTVSLSGTEFTVGAYASSSGLSGSMDEFRLYNRALSDAEILATYNIELGGCSSPDNVALDTAGCDELTISWDSDTAAVGSVVEYGPTGFTPGTGTTVFTASSPFTITGLSPSMDYDIYVSDSCTSGLSAPSDSLPASTLPLPVGSFTSTVVTVTFNDAEYEFDATASTDANTYNWDFGDGNTGTGMVVNHTYTMDSTYTVTLVTEGDCGFDTISEPVVVRGISVDTWDAQGFKTHPNPVKDVLFINASRYKGQSYSVTLVDMSGRMMYHARDVQGNSEINMQNLPAGTYILNVDGESGMYRQNVIKQ